MYLRFPNHKEPSECGNQLRLCAAKLDEIYIVTHVDLQSSEQHHS